MCSHEPTFRNLDAFMTSPLLRQAGGETAKLFQAIDQPQLDVERLAKAIENFLQAIDWEASRAEIGKLANTLLPIEHLLPPIYADWKPVLREAVAFLACHLPSERMIPKLVDQIVKPDRSLPARAIAFLAHMPTLQKLGQIVARNRNLHPDFRDELVKLENSIRDVDPAAIFLRIESELGPRLRRDKIKIESFLHAEASVSAVVRFSWQHPDHRLPQQGVLKVLKPGIEDSFRQEMDVLQSLVAHLDENCPDHPMAAADLGRIVEEVRQHLAPELDLRREQAHLQSAQKAYGNVSFVRIPELIPHLCTDRVTAMTYEEGCKIAEAFAKHPAKRRLLAERLFQAAAIQPLLEPETPSLLHADPHAGNLLVDPHTGDLIILDWALTTELPLDLRQQIVRLASAFALRDESMATRALARLCRQPPALHAETHQLIASHCSQAIKRLSPFQMPDLNDVAALVDALAFAGVPFRESLLVFRKVLSTLDGIIHQLTGELDLPSTASGYFASKNPLQLLQLFSPCAKSALFDSMELARSAPWLGFRLHLTWARQLFQGN